MKPDFGIHLFESTKHIGPHLFYDVIFPNIDRIEHNLFTSTINNIYNGIEYCVSFDFPMVQMSYFIDRILNIEDKSNFLALMFSKEHFQFTFLQPIVLSVIECEIGKLFVNQNESYRPLTVVKIG